MNIFIVAIIVSKIWQYEKIRRLSKQPTDYSYEIVLPWLLHRSGLCREKSQKVHLFRRWNKYSAKLEAANQSLFAIQIIICDILYRLSLPLVIFETFVTGSRHYTLLLIALNWYPTPHTFCMYSISEADSLERKVLMCAFTISSTLKEELSLQT